MKDKIVFLCYTLLASFLWCGCENEIENQWKVASPDGDLVTRISVNEEGKLSYRVSKINGEVENVMLEPSPLGLVRNDGRFDRLEYTGVKSVEIVNEDYWLKTGKQLKNNNHYNELSLQFSNEAGNALNVVFRAYDEGVAFKYVFPENGNELEYTLEEELTGFDLPSGNAFLQAYDSATAYAPAYERNYGKAIEIGTDAPGKEGWCFPALFEINGNWLLLSESNLKENFHGSHIKPKATNGLYEITGPEEEEAFGYGQAKASSKLPWEMPWRVMMIGEELADIVESNLINHLADSSKIGKADWVIPGRASWAWWSGYLDGSNDSPEKLKHFIDFAQEMGWEYSLIDAGWDYRPGFNLEEITQYAANRGVGLLLWYNSGGPINRVNAGPRDMMFDPEIRRKEMKRISDLGIKGIKIDFFSSDKQDFIKLFKGILRDAAEFNLLVNFHGCTIPRGWARTYPNMISYESVKGSEAYIYHSDFEKNSPVHNTILPFTRNVIGSMDYTPVAFSTQQVPHRTSFGHELALSVVYESGIIHFPDTPEVYQSQPTEVLEFLKAIPAAWDETQFLGGYPGKDVLIARKKNEAWFVGGINGEDKKKEFSVPLDFLDNEEYEVLVISDGKDPKHFEVKREALNAANEVIVDVLPFGGFVMKIIPSNNSN
ncbi:glycoside hydrolase family 97 protein [Echinicola shivajiensis]|uniref:glycoside hydrolase family 97 protein n=1 Tax=Echinicola shivajiensis TaxID=1035916 RepID=UPI001BFC0786|nr:glycoside hydrolase family 97 protein [Echinicola shivajiensis]